MKDMIRKIKDQKGATIVFALVVFMIAAVISAMIVNVAMANLSRTASRKSKEQARIAVVSAAKYLESDDSDLLTAMDAVHDNDVWTFGVNGDANADKALKAKIKWTDVSTRHAMTAEITSGDDVYFAKVRLTYNSTDSHWEIVKVTKK